MVLSRSINFLISTNLRQTVVQSKQYSSFPSSYVKPIYKHADQEALFQTEEGKQIAHLQIKPAFTSETSSEFHDPLIGKFINYIMRNGNKILARSLLEKAFEHVKIMQLKRYNHAAPENKKDIELDPKVIFHRAVENCIPILQLQNMKRGGIIYQVPVPVRGNRAKFLAMNWLIRTAKEKEGSQRFSAILAKELIDASNNTGRVIKRKQELHKQCEANRAYAHFRWL